MSSAVEKSIDNILLTYLHKNAFSGCAAGLSGLEKNSFKRTFYYRGRTDKTDTAMQIGSDTFFDLASLTKPLVTVLCLLALKKEGKLEFEDILEDHLPYTFPVEKKAIKIIDLIRHTSGLPAHRPYFNQIRESKKTLDINDVVEMIIAEELICKPGEKYIYSDLDYILLGYLIERLSGEDLGKFWQKKIIKPLDLSKEFFWENNTEREIHSLSFAATGMCNWTEDRLCGKVHDDNCRAMNRLSGHAGLFGTLTGVLTLCEDILLNYSGRKENSVYRREDLLYLLQDRKRQQWAFGFDVPTGDVPSSGTFFSKKSIGHLGFTGTSFWIDLEKNRIIVMLTNRVLCGNDNKNIKEVRPLLHDALLREYQEKEKLS
jgi:serine-type D-Ala-D-Ala carboxypeptidase